MQSQWTDMTAVAWAQLWQVTLLVIVVAILVRVLGGNRPYLAYALLLVVLVKCVTPPLFTSASGVFCWLQPVETVAIVEPTPIQPPDLASLSAPSDAGDGDLVIPLYPLEALPTEPAGSPVTIEPQRPRFSLKQLAFWGLAVWAIGAALSLALSAWHWQACLRTARRTRADRSADLEQRVQSLAQRIGLRRPVRVSLTKGKLGPAVTGILRPTLLLPEGIVHDRTPDEIEPILAHELIHIRRGDLWAGVLQTLVLALWWFHPLVRWSVRQAMREAEQCCDEAVLAELGCQPKEYARGLLDVLQYKTNWMPAPAFPGAGRIDATAKRLERIMRLGQGCRRRSPWWCWLVMLAVAAIVLPGGAFVVSGERETPPEAATDEAPLSERHNAGSPAESESVLPPIRVASKPDEPIFVQSYAVAHVAENLAEAMGSDVKTAKNRLLQHLGFNQKGNGTLGGGVFCAWFEDRLIISATEEAHDEIQRELELVRRHGLAQLHIEVLCFSGEPAAVKKIASGLNVPGVHVEPADRPDFADKWQAAHVTGSLEEISKRFRNSPNVRVLTRPQLVTVSGQQASIHVGSEVPVLVSDSKSDTDIRHAFVGLAVNVAPYLRRHNSMRLRFDATLSRLKGNGETDGDFASELGEAAHAGTQITTIETSSEVYAPLNETVAIQAYSQRDVEGKAERLLFLVRASKFKPEPAEVHTAEDMESRNTEPDSLAVPLFIHAYDVADLVLPLPGARVSEEPTGSSAETTPPTLLQSAVRTKRRHAPAMRARSRPVPNSGFHSLINLITSTIAPDSWEETGGSGSIAPFEENLSLVIRQNGFVHAEIVDLLKQLRHMQDLRVVLRTRTIELSGAFCKQHWPEMSEQTPSTVMNPARTKRLLAQAVDSCRVVDGPTVTLFNGQQVYLPLVRPAESITANARLTLQAVVSDDHRSVRLTGVTISKDLQRATHHALESSSGDTCALEISELVDADEPSRRSFVLITPLIEEEEQRVGVATRVTERR